MADEMVLVIFSSSIESEMMDALQSAGVECYTKLVGVQGVGTCSAPRLDSHVWPGFRPEGEHPPGHKRDEGHPLGRGRQGVCSADHFLDVAPWGQPLGVRS